MCERNLKQLLLVCCLCVYEFFFLCRICAKGFARRVLSTHEGYNLRYKFLFCAARCVIKCFGTKPK